jgi:hydroxypyruvate isomerase
LFIVTGMPRFAANLNWLFTEHAFLDRFAAAAAAGFRAVEFPSPYEHPASEIRARLDAHGLECILFNVPSGDRSLGDFGIACRPERKAEFRAGVQQAIEYARVLGVRQVNVISGRVLEGDDPQALDATLRANLRFTAREFAAAGLDLLIEPINSVDVKDFAVPRADDGARLVRELAEPNFGLQLDLYHTAMMGDDGHAALAAHRPIVRHIQFADAPGRGEPGTGTLDLARLFSDIDSGGYGGWVSAEYRPSGRTEQSLHWMPRAD